MDGSDRTPSPWSVLNDYTKTVVTVAAALLAFTGTFSTADRLATAPIWPLLICWVLLVLAIAAALYSAGKLTGFLMGGRSSSDVSLLMANFSYFFLFAAVVAFLVFAIMATSKSHQMPGHNDVELFEPAASFPLLSQARRPRHRAALSNRFA